MTAKLQHFPQSHYFLENGDFTNLLTLCEYQLAEEIPKMMAGKHVLLTAGSSKGRIGSIREYSLDRRGWVIDLDGNQFTLDANDLEFLP
jgi:ribosomal protein S4E